MLTEHKIGYAVEFLIRRDRSHSGDLYACSFLPLTCWDLFHDRLWGRADLLQLLAPHTPHTTLSQIAWPSEFTVAIGIGMFR